MENNGAFSITAEECAQIEKEHQINHIIIGLERAKDILGDKVTIEDALTELYKRTRFAEEVKNYVREKNTLASLMYGENNSGGI